MFATMRCLFSFTLVVLAALALISDTVEAKHTKKHHPRKGVQILNDQDGQGDDDDGQNGDAGGLIKWKSGSGFSANASLSVHTSISVNSNNNDGSWFNGNKMGLAGGQGLGLFDKVAFFTDWTCNPYSNEVAKKRKIPGIAMFWGIGKCTHDHDPERYAECKRMKCGQYPYVAFLNEFDVTGDTMSGGMSIQETFDVYNKYVLPHRKCGSKIIGPSCAMGLAETKCTQWYHQVKDKPDAISVHLFTTNIEATKRLIEHYLKFGLPIVVTEMACIDYGKKPVDFCKAEHIKKWFAETTDYFNSQPMIVGWAASDAANGDEAGFTQGGQGKSLTVVGKFIKELFKKFNKHGFNDESQRMQRRRI